MGKNSAIEWTDHTFNPWWGCVKIASGCANCYAKAASNRFGFDVWGPNKQRRIFGDKHWHAPIKWNRQAGENERQDKVFCGSMCDIFERHPDPEYDRLVLDAQRAKLWNLIDYTQNLIWLLLTKRPENIDAMLPDRWTLNHLPPNVWLGYSASTQDDFERGWPMLESFAYFHHPSVIFISLEPLLGPIDLSGWLESDPGYADEDNYERGDRGIDWVIAGGESGPGARPTHPFWALSVRNQCLTAGVPFFWKQWGRWKPTNSWDGRKALSNATWVDNLMTPKVQTAMIPVGKKAAGRLLDGKEYSEYP